MSGSQWTALHQLITSYYRELAGYFGKTTDLSMSDGGPSSIVCPCPVPELGQGGSQVPIE